MSIFSQKCALITGIGGQDAHYLSLKLLDLGVRVVGTSRNAEMYAYLGALPEAKNLSIVDWDLLDQARFKEILEGFKPDYLFNLAGMSSGADMNRDPPKIAKVNGFAVMGMLESVRLTSPGTRFIQASSAEIFGASQASPQTELSSRAPRSAYGVAKVFADGIVKLYRDEFGMQCGSAILYNHESPLRSEAFVTRKIASAVAAISTGALERIRLGNLSSRRDWSHARDIADGLWRLAQADALDDYVFATGTTHTVREFAELAFGHVGIELDWSGSGLDELGVCRKSGEVRVSVEREYFRPTETELLTGDATKARIELGWEPTTTFEDLVKEMVDADLENLTAEQPAGARSWKQHWA